MSGSQGSGGPFDAIGEAKPAQAAAQPALQAGTPAQAEAPLSSTHEQTASELLLYLSKLRTEAVQGQASSDIAQLDAAMQALAAQASAQLHDMPGRALSSAAWAAARHRQHATWAPSLLLAIQDESLHRLRGQQQQQQQQQGAGQTPPAAADAASQGASSKDLPSESLTEILHASALSGQVAHADFLAAAATALQNCQLSLQDTASLVWSFAKLGGKPLASMQQLLQVLAGQALRCLHNTSLPLGSLQTLLQVIQGYALLQFNPGPQLVTAAAVAAQGQADSAGPKDLVFLLWSFAKLTGQPLQPELLAFVDSAHHHLIAQLSEPATQSQFKPHMLSSLLWACATLSNASSDLLNAIAQAVRQQLPLFQPPDLGHAIWAFAVLGHHPGLQLVDGMCARLAAAWQQPEGGLLPQELAKLLLALAILTHHPGAEVLDLAAAQALRQVQLLASEDLSTMLWAFATLGHLGAAPLTLPIIQSASSWTAADYTANDAARLLWAVGVLQGLQGEAAHVLVGLCSSLQASSLSPDCLLQLFQAHMLLQALPQGPSGRPQLPGALVQLCEAAWRSRLADTAPDQARAQVAGALAGMQIPCTVAATANNGLLPIDVALPQLQIALCVEGTTAFCSNEPYRPLGTTLLAWSLLRAHGWQVLTIPFYIWGGLRTLVQQQTYLVQLLPSRDLQNRGQDLAYNPQRLSQPTIAAGTSQPIAALSHKLQGALTLSELATTGQPALSGPQPLSRGDPPHSLPLPGQPVGLEQTRIEAGSPHLSSSVEASSGRGSPSILGPSGLRPPDQQPGLLYQGPSLQGAQVSAAALRAAGLGPDVAAAMPLSLGPPAGAEEGDLRRYWSMVTRMDPGSVDAGRRPGGGGGEGVSVSELRRIIELQPLETPAAAAVASRLALLNPAQFSALLGELARDNHAFRAWQLFDWVRSLPEDHDLRRLCDSSAYTTMIALCGTWQQLRRALQLVAEMRARSLECGLQAYNALLMAAVKGGETDLAVDVYHKMGSEGMSRPRTIFATIVDVHVRNGKLQEALSVLGDMHAAGLTPEVHLYNLLLVACTKLVQPRSALDVYKRMLAEGATPNTKTYTALIGSVGKLGNIQQALGIVGELLAADAPANAPATYAALLAACEKGGLWDLAIALFEKMCSEGIQPDVGIFNSMIAACAHGGEYTKARSMFDRLPKHGCKPDAVTFANLIRAYKKGGQWCLALDTFEAMQASGCQPHTAVFSSIIDVLWQTGIGWAQAKALRLFTSAVRTGSLAPAVESCKKGVLKVDLQALTVGVAVLSMAAWLSGARDALMHSAQPALDASRKLAVVNGLGEHSHAQGHSAAVKEAVGAALQGFRAPFRLVQDHSRSGRLEAPSLALKSWLFSENFAHYLALVQGDTGPVVSTADFLKVEQAEAGRCTELFQRIQTYERHHPILLKVLHERAVNYLGVRKALVGQVIGTAGALGLGQEVVHTAVAQMDRVMASGSLMTDAFQALFVCACLRLAAIQEGGFIPAPAAVAALVAVPGPMLERVEANVTAVLRNDTECISSVHCLKVYVQRLGCDLLNGMAVRKVAGIAFPLAMEMLGDLPALQFPPSLLAAAMLHAARKAQGCVPFWPSVLAQLTGFSDAGSAPFVSATSLAERVCDRLLSGPEAHYGYL